MPTIDQRTQLQATATEGDRIKPYLSSLIKFKNANTSASVVAVKQVA